MVPLLRVEAETMPGNGCFGAVDDAPRCRRAPRTSFAIMFETFELPAPVSLGSFDDLELAAAVDTATLVESLALEVRIAVIQQMYTRQLHTTAGTRPTPSAPRAALPPPRSRRRRRKARKRRNRR